MATFKLTDEQIEAGRLAAEGLGFDESGQIETPLPSPAPIEPITTPVPQVDEPITGVTFDNVATPEVTEKVDVPTPDISQIQVDDNFVNPNKDFFKGGGQGTNDFNQQIESSLARLSGREADVSAQTGQATATLDRELIELNKQLKLQQAQAMADQEKALRQGETLGFASGEAQRVARNNAVETLRLSALIEAKQGNITFAKKQAEDAVNAQYAQIEKDVEIQRQNIINNYDSFTAKEKKRADSLLLQLDEKDAFVAQEKANRTAVDDVVIQAAQLGAGNQVLDAMRKSGSAVEAAQIAANAGVYLQPVGVGEGIDTSVLDKGALRSLEQANTAITNIDNVLRLMESPSAAGPIRRITTKVIPGSAGFDLNASLNTVKALIGFDALQKMRDASPTGGALGQVSEREIGFLQSVAGSLDAGQSNEQFTQTLSSIRESFTVLTFMINAKQEGYSDTEVQDYLREQGQI